MTGDAGQVGHKDEQQLLQPEEDLQANSAGDIEENPLCGDGEPRSQRVNELAQWDRDQLLGLQAQNLKEIYYGVERSFLTKQRKCKCSRNFSFILIMSSIALTSDWIAKNQNEKP